MALTSDKLKDIFGLGVGLTTNFKVQYDDSLPSKANAIAAANALLDVIESEFTALTGAGWFNVASSKFGTSKRVNLRLEYKDPDGWRNINKTGDGWGAVNWGYPDNTICLDPQNANTNAANAAEIVKFLFVAEFVEILMDITGKWNRGDSMGEGLSVYSAITRFQTGYYSYNNFAVDTWLNQHPRQDWVNKTEGTDGNLVSFGCALAFLYYLNTQLNFSINQIIAAGAANLATVYRTLTGDSGDPDPFFAGLLERVYPSSANANIPGPVFDNPFPLAQLSFWMDKDTFGKDEVQDVINTSGGTWPKALWLMIEGFSKNSFQALNVTIPAPTGPFANLPGITISQNPDIDFENATNPQAPQRILIPFDITFTNASLNDFPPAGNQTYALNAFLNYVDQTGAIQKIPESDASTQFELVAGADPYFTNIDPKQNNAFYLSQDLRVFTATPAQNNTPVVGGSAFPNSSNPSTTDAYNYIQSLLTWLNKNYSDPSGSDPFNTLLPGQAGALQGDSSVTPITVDFSNIFSPKIYNNYNFALARVRLRGSAGPAGAASNVRVFFRLWSSQTADTDYQAGSTYPSTLDAAGLPDSPLVGGNHQTLPFFATGNLTGNTDYGVGGANTRDIQIQTGKDNIWAYFGCFLNLYDANNVIDGKAVQAWLNGTHHCIVAQIAYDGAPVIAGASPESSDKLAQRNLQITHSDNPGGAETHRIPQTFDIRPSGAVAGASACPDELMIDWGAIPHGSVASIYWPRVLASDVLALASALYSSHTLIAADPHTIQCKVTGGVTYIPIPTGAGENFAGLFTVDLPSTVVTGQEFNIVVRRIATRQRRQIDLRTQSLPATVKMPKEGEKAGAVIRPTPETVAVAVSPKLKVWRYVVGTFQIRIPVSGGKAMLFAEENTLAIMKWRLQQMVPSNRWYPVLQRYISYISARVDGLGSDSAAIKPSLQGVPVKGKEHEKLGEERTGYTGKVSALIYDRFGDFEAFILDTEDGKKRFNAREPEIEHVVNRAWSERILTSVFVELDAPHRPEEIVLHCPPLPLKH